MNMKKIIKLFAIISILFASFSAHAQDKISLNEGDIIYCKILSTDSAGYTYKELNGFSKYILKSNTEYVCFDCDKSFVDIRKPAGYYLKISSNCFKKQMDYGIGSVVLIGASRLIANQLIGKASNTFGYEATQDVMYCFIGGAAISYIFSYVNHIKAVKYLGMEGSLLQLKFPIK